MPDQTRTTTAGLPVEIGKIERELKKLWEQGGELMTRASLINLAVYSEAPDSLAANTQIVAQVTEDHACRALVIAANPSLEADKVQAWINAHCHVSGGGSKQVCSEQISFLLEGSLANLLPSIVFSHLDSDLPFYLWWQEEFREPIDPQLWSWVDRLIYDSQSWNGVFETQMGLLEQIQAEANQRVVLCDLNWTRLTQIRQALAQFFDHPASHQRLAEIERVEIDFSSSYRSTAVLLAAWFGAQLGWTPAAEENHALDFSDCSGKPIRVALQETTGDAISRSSIFCGTTEFRVTHTPGARLLEASMQVEGVERMHLLVPAGSNDLVALMSEELMRGGSRRVYLRAMQTARNFL